MVIKLYYTSITSTHEIKKHQQRIDMILTSKKYDFQKIDVSQSVEARDKMRDLMKDPHGLPPQIFNEDVYCGGYEAFHEAVECEELDKFLKPCRHHRLSAATAT